MRIAKACLIVIIVFCALRTIYTLDRPTNQEDFAVYYTSGALVAAHAKNNIYDGADTGADPQLAYAKPDSLFATTARQLGLPKIRMYVYPPLLADLLVPLSLVSFHTATIVWTVINSFAVLLVWYFSARLLGVPLQSSASLVLLLGVALFGPVSQCLLWGQVTLLLLLLTVVGIYSYSRQAFAVSACCIALATAIKLTPAILVLPFLIWKDWKWLRYYSFFLVATFVLVCAVNSPTIVIDYFRHVMPSMSGAIADGANRSVPSYIQIFYAHINGLIHGPSYLSRVDVIQPLPASLIPEAVKRSAKLVSLVLIVVAFGIFYRFKTVDDTKERISVLALFSMLSVPLSPVSWSHAYVMTLPAIIILWGYVLRRPMRAANLAILSFCSLELGSFLFTGAFARVTHGLLSVFFGALGPLTALLLFFWGLFYIQREGERALADSITTTHERRSTV